MARRSSFMLTSMESIWYSIESFSGASKRPFCLGLPVSRGVPRRVREDPRLSPIRNDIKEADEVGHRVNLAAIVIGDWSGSAEIVGGGRVTPCKRLPLRSSSLTEKLIRLGLNSFTEAGRKGRKAMRRLQRIESIASEHYKQEERSKQIQSSAADVPTVEGNPLRRAENYFNYLHPGISCFCKCGRRRNRRCDYRRSQPISEEVTTKDLEISNRFGEVEVEMLVFARFCGEQFGGELRQVGKIEKEGGPNKARGVGKN
ncbi:hypothetical protein H6P81_016074 [Aristolochia fimbriata]|uniref:Uncharacterized protein n=1 Tax=Aristolochia fimbriata TaxID=158543 RepID=A0AAV7E7Y9_ARIFI|nr:hypothetical protein H6P81_016074 [Aristolochia fimbriata]